MESDLKLESLTEDSNPQKPIESLFDRLIPVCKTAEEVA
jgi:hypothetical protein